MKQQLTVKTVFEHPAPSSGRDYLYDAKCPGLALCVTANGTRTFYRCGRVDGKPVRIRLGTVPALSLDQARKVCAQHNARIAAGQNPHKERKDRREEATLGELWAWYFEHQSRPHKATWKAEERRWNLDLQRWDRRRLSEFTHDELSSFLNQVRETRGLHAANKLRELLRNMYAVSHRVGYTGHNPTTSLRRFKGHDRERYLLPAEVSKFFDAVAQLKRETTRDFFLLCLYTGARRSNICSMEWSELDLESGVWNIPSSKMKNRRAAAIPLTTHALEILRRRHASRGDSRWVLPGQSREGHYSEPKSAMRKIRALSGIDNLRVHDLRRTYASWMAGQDVPLQVIGRALAHASLSSTGVYARLSLAPVREAATKATEAIHAASQKKS